MVRLTNRLGPYDEEIQQTFFGMTMKTKSLNTKTAKLFFYFVIFPGLAEGRKQMKGEYKEANESAEEMNYHNARCFLFDFLLQLKVRTFFGKI